MSFSYDPERGSAIDQLRFLVNDTTAEGAEFQDEEISMLITAGGGTRQAGIALAQRLVTRFAALADVSVGDLSVSYGAQADAARGLVDMLRSIRGTSLPIAYSGGISIGDRDSVSGDLDRVQPLFALGQDDSGVRRSPSETRSGVPDSR